MKICVLTIFFTVWGLFDCVQSSPASPRAWSPRPESSPSSPSSSREPSPESSPASPRAWSPRPVSSPSSPSSSREPSPGPSSSRRSPPIPGYEFDSHGILMPTAESRREAFLNLLAFAQMPPHKQDPDNIRPAIHKAQILVPIASDIYYRDEDFAGRFVTPNLIHRINFATLEPVMHNGQPVVIHKEELRPFDELIRDKHLYGKYDGMEFRKLAKHLREKMIP